MNLAMIWKAVEPYKDLVLFVVAIYAAGLSTWNLRQALRKDRRQIRVTQGTAMPTFNGRVGNAWADIQATNVGQRPVTITRLGLIVKGGGQIVSLEGRPPGLQDTPLPTTLTDGQTARAFLAYRDIGEALLRNGITGKATLVAVCEDSTGKTHRGEKWEVDPKELITM